ncbi:hypothetical protein [Streptomyces clavuligerus]|uniref:hypothetical protein n=1 Tax=Streptomyces clavuligerus TaxID=1901 RepID=UPI0018D06050|nr:hypothetical protein [Streptomyces clavuligerus]
MPRLTEATGYGHVLSLCGELHPEHAKTFCTEQSPAHDGDHVHEYTGTTWPRRPEPGEQVEVGPECRMDACKFCPVDATPRCDCRCHRPEHR